MRILFLTQIIPYPPDAGPKVKTWHVLRYLVDRGHQVTLVSFLRPEEAPFVPIVQALCKEVYTVPIRRSRLADVWFLTRSQVSGRPFLVERDESPTMRKKIHNILQNNHFDAIHADQLTMTQFALPYSAKKPLIQNNNPRKLAKENHHSFTHPTLIFDAHNAVWTIIDRMRENAGWFTKPFLSLETARIRKYEAMVVQNFDYTLAVTEHDRQALIDTLGLSDEASKSEGSPSRRIQVTPIAVDTEQLTPISPSFHSNNIVTLGTLHYPPNADGIRWFAKEVFPIIQQDNPQVTLTIIGKNPPPDFFDLAERSRGAIRVTGYVPDLLPYFKDAAVLVVPVRAGGGMRVRILEAFALGMPVVTTTIGLEGIVAKESQDILVADMPGEFAKLVMSVLDNSQLGKSLANNGRHFVVNHYDWQVVLRQLDKIYPPPEDDRRVTQR